jgi:hypothetical protein
VDAPLGVPTPAVILGFLGFVLRVSLCILLRSNGGFNIGLISSRWEQRMYIPNECYTAKVVSLNYAGGAPSVKLLANNYPGSISAIDDVIYTTTTDGATNATAFVEV